MDLLEEGIYRLYLFAYAAPAFVFFMECEHRFDDRFSRLFEPGDLLLAVDGSAFFEGLLPLLSADAVLPRVVFEPVRLLSSDVSEPGPDEAYHVVRPVALCYDVTEGDHEGCRRRMQYASLLVHEQPDAVAGEYAPAHRASL